jgi:hypothetical protein
MTETERIVPLKGSIKINTGALLKMMGISPYQMLRTAVLILAYNSLNKIKEMKLW